MEVSKELAEKADNAFKKIKVGIIAGMYSTKKLYLLSFEELDILKSLGLIADKHVAKEKMYREQYSKEIWK